MKKAIFLDRDGTINEWTPEIDCIKSPEQLKLLPGAGEAISLINGSDFLPIIITNQPGIAKGFLTEEDLSEIHQALKRELAKKHAYVTDIFYCPHHPEKGWEGEVPSLKIDCDCRKPKPGLIFLACEKYGIDPTQSYMVGDQQKDIDAGISAGCKVVQRIDNEYTLLHAVYEILKEN
jgi:D-glycero-D-manno-heptose 1,7-bisphosphate phosphatase